MAVEEDIDREERLAYDDTLAERVEKVDVEDDETCSTDEMRERLDL